MAEPPNDQLVQSSLASSRPHPDLDESPVQSLRHVSDITTLTQETGLRSRLLACVATQPDEVWFPNDFADLGNRPAIEKNLLRPVALRDLRRINRSL
ncbi:MAG: hypothetical protein OXI81_00270 [Paracoccaceae bacterium]|nr:hypothetical protein [Paracoccaceae bacterium]